MIHTNNRAESIRLASFIDRDIERNLNIKILGVKGANFHVLRGTRMPAVLIEVGFLSNYDEECKLKNSYYRQQIADAIAEGIEGYARNIHLAEFR
jgi:N-acetylmuramoyl-L-alanine amidase